MSYPNPTPAPWRIERAPGGTYRIVAGLSALVTVAEVATLDDARVIVEAPALFNHVHDVTVDGTPGEYVRMRATLERMEKSK